LAGHLDNIHVKFDLPSWIFVIGFDSVSNVEGGFLRSVKESI